jgi:putative tryptophan/tyrosine transport system substrate-binding protein
MRFVGGLGESGHVEGQNVTIDHRLAAGRFDRFPEMAADLVQRRVSVIAAFGSVAAVAAKAATETLPILFAVTEDPVRLGLVASLPRPGGNATGLNFFTTEVNAKRLSLLRELVPAAARVALLTNPNKAASAIACITRSSHPAQNLKMRRLYASGSASFQSTA